jgi:hypothetical protein
MHRRSTRYNTIQKTKEAIMGFVVTREGGIRDAELETYGRVLQYEGKNLSNLPRVPDPENPKRNWVCLWNTREEAQHFIDELEQEPGDHHWRIEETAARPSNGPFGPVLFYLARQGDGQYLGLYSLSRRIIQKIFPGAAPAVSNVFSETETWNHYQKAGKHLSDLVEEVAPCLTGLGMDHLTDLGYAVIDEDTNRTWVHVPPAGITRFHASDGADGRVYFTRRGMTHSQRSGSHG